MLLYQVVAIPDDQLNVHAHATSGVGVDVLMEQWLVALYCPIGIQQSNFLRLTSQSGSGMSLHADQQPSLPQGAGAWATQLNIRPDGSFSGEYWDMDMGSTGDGYPNGTQYGNTFTGTFTDLKKVNDYTWSMKLDKINYAYEIGKEEILDQILYSYTEAYGLDGADEVDIYLPGAPVDQLPEEFLQWACSNYDRFEAEENGLPCYGLYNVEGAEGFSGYDSVDTAKTYVENTEKAAKELEDSLQNDSSLSQGDMNEKSQELYEDWDDALNHIWYELKVKGVLTEDAMAKLLDEQRAWIKDKEAAVQEAGKEAEGGSLQPLLENTEAAKWTRERTYVLLNILLEVAGRETVTME